jgi:hypothetical protein
MEGGKERKEEGAAGRRQRWQPGRLLVVGLKAVTMVAFPQAASRDDVTSPRRRDHEGAAPGALPPAWSSSTAKLPPDGAPRAADAPPQGVCSRARLR